MTKFEVSKVEEAKIANGVYNYDEAVDLAGNGRYNFMVLVTCSMIAIAVAIDMFAFGIVVAAGACDLELTLQDKGLLSSTPFAGIFFAFFWGYFADTAGRRKALIWATTGGFIFAALSSFASGLYTILVLKFIGCSFSSATFSLSMTYLGESTGNKHRSSFLQIMNCFNLLSETVGFGIAFLVLNLSFNIPMPWLGITFRPWRLMTLVYASTLGACALMMCFLYESPKFLASSGDVKQALEVLKKIFERNGGQIDDYIVKSIKLPEQMKKTDENMLLSMAKSLVPLFTTPLVGRTLTMFYLIIVICVTNNAFTVWFPAIVNTFFLTLGDGQSKSFCERINDNSTLIITEDLEITCNDTISNHTLYCGMVFGLAFTIVNITVAKFTWRRLILIVTFLVSASSFILIDLVDHPVANIIFFALMQITSICIGVCGSFFVDLFPTSHRGLVTSLGMMMARLGSFTGVNLIGGVIANYCHVTFISWAGFVFSGILVTFLLPSDAKMKKILQNDT